MPRVRVKGVANPMDFPEDMDIEDIKAFLQRKFAGLAASGEQRLDLGNKPETMQGVDESISQKITRGIGDTLLDTGMISNNQDAYRIGGNVGALAENAPFVGDVVDVDDFGRAVANNDKLGMALGVIGAVPIAGDIAKKALRKLRNVTLPSGRLGADEFKFIKQSDPSAKAKANPDGSVNVSYLDEYRPTQIKGPLHEFDPDGLELSEGDFKNVRVYRGDKNKPISVTKENGNYIILDGHHRAKLAKEEGRNVKAIVIPLEDVKDMQKGNIHQADMFSEWVATGKHKPTNQSSVLGGGLPMEPVKRVTSYNDMYDFTPEQMAQQLRSSNPKNVVNGVYVEQTTFGEKRFNPDGSVEIIKDGSVLRRIEPQDSDMVYKNKIMKNEGEKPEVKAAQEQRRADIDTERARQKARESDSYKMQHTAPTREDNSSGDNLTDTFGEDIYSGKAKQYYGTGSSYDDKAINIIQSMRGNPEKAVTIYRAVPKSVSTINPTDWVTTTREYAKEHMTGEKGWHILSKKVKAKDIATDGNSIHEFGYDPTNQSSVLGGGKFKGKVFHQTDADFKDFDFDKTADGTVWFTSDKANFSDPNSSAGAAAGKGRIIEREVELNKVAGYDELDKYSIDELIQQGYDGALLDGDIQVFNPDAIKP